MNSRLLKLSLAAAIALGLLASAAHANLITPAGNLESGNDNTTNMSTHLGVSVVLLYKAEYDDGVFDKEEGLFAPAGGPSGPNFTITTPYGTDFNMTDISWNLTGTGFELRGVAWKSAQDYWWSGIETDQYLVGGPHTIATSGKAISHVSFYGLRGGTSVPDGGFTLALLGMALLGIGGAKRFLFKARR